MLNNWGWVLLVPGHRTLVKTQWKVGCYAWSLSCIVQTPSYRLVPAMRKREHVFSTLAILSSFVGGVTLISLVLFDTKHYLVFHRVLVFIFILGVVTNGIFLVIEVRSVASAATHYKTPICHSLAMCHSIDGCLEIMEMTKNSDSHTSRRQSLPPPPSRSYSPLPSGFTSRSTWEVSQVN